MNEIHTVQQLIDLLVTEKSGGKTLWFRGQANEQWELKPFLNRLSSAPSEATMLKKFKQSALMLLNSHPKQSFDWLFLMQHYGVPTRLLDWSESPLIALYFAVENMAHSSTNGALWLLDPCALNKHARINKSSEADYIPSFEDEVLDSYSIESLLRQSTLQLYPVATIATRNNPRIQAQQGVFTIHHLDPSSIESIGDGSHVKKIVIPSAAKIALKEQLALLGYTKFQLFPELASIGDIIKENIR